MIKHALVCNNLPPPPHRSASRQSNAATYSIAGGIRQNFVQITAKDYLTLLGQSRSEGTQAQTSSKCLEISEEACLSGSRSADIELDS